MFHPFHTDLELDGRRVSICNKRIFEGLQGRDRNPTTSLGRRQHRCRLVAHSTVLRYLSGVTDSLRLSSSHSVLSDRYANRAGCDFFPQGLELSFIIITDSDYWPPGSTRTSIHSFSLCYTSNNLFPLLGLDLPACSCYIQRGPLVGNS